jgi:hypothetical protein
VATHHCGDGFVDTEKREWGMGRKIFFYTLAFVLLNFHAVGAAFKTDNVTITGQKSKASLSTDSDGKIVEGSGGANDTVYGSGWNGSTAQAPSQNAVYDKVEALVLGGGEGSTVADTATIDLTLTGTEIKGDVILLKDLVTTAPLTGGTNDIFPGADTDITIAIPKATAAADGYLNATDFSTFNGKAAGTVNVSQSGAVANTYFPIWTATNVIANSTYSTTDATNWNTAYNNFLNKSNETLYLQNGSIDTSAEIAAIVGDETGTGVMVWNTSPSIKTPTIIGTAEATGFFNASNINATNVNSTNVNVATKITMPASQINSSHVVDYAITGTDITNTTIDDIKKKEFNIIFTVLEPDAITNATGLPTRAFLVPFPSDTRTYTISSIQSFSDVDNANFSLLKSVNATNVTAAACVYLQNVSIADNGESVFSNTTTSLTNATIEAGKHLIFQDLAAVNDTYKKLIIKGNFS